MIYIIYIPMDLFSNIYIYNYNTVFKLHVCTTENNLAWHVNILSRSTYSIHVLYIMQYSIIGIHWGVSIKDTAYSTGIRTAYNMTCRQTLC